jgi:hypothetical protein
MKKKNSVISYVTLKWNGLKIKVGNTS